VPAFYGEDSSAPSFPDSQTGGPLVVICSRVLIEYAGYILSHIPYLQDVWSIRSLRPRHAVVSVAQLAWQNNYDSKIKSLWKFSLVWESGVPQPTLKIVLFWVLAPSPSSDGSSMFLRTVGIYRRVYTAPKPRRTTSSPPWKPQISHVENVVKDSFLNCFILPYFKFK
jgi:hypothetical protein